MNRDMSDNASSEINKLLDEQGNRLTRALYVTRQKHLVEVNVEQAAMANLVILAPTKLEYAQVSSALGFAMQAERADIYSRVDEAFLQFNSLMRETERELAAPRNESPADEEKIVKLERRLLREDAITHEINRIRDFIRQRGATSWPWAWRDDQSETTLALATNESDEKATDSRLD